MAATPAPLFTPGTQPFFTMPQAKPASGALPPPAAVVSGSGALPIGKQPLFPPPLPPISTLPDLYPLPASATGAPPVAKQPLFSQLPPQVKPTLGSQTPVFASASGAPQKPALAESASAKPGEKQCIRCGKKYSDPEETCRWHTTAATVKAMLNRLPSANTVLCGQTTESRDPRFLYPLFTHGLGRYDKQLVYVCCGRRVEKGVDNGCWVGKHSENDPLPELSDIVRGVLPTYWEPCSLTGHAAVGRIKDALAAKNYDEAGYEEYVFNMALGAKPPKLAGYSWSYLAAPKFGLPADVDMGYGVPRNVQQFRSGIRACKAWESEWRSIAAAVASGPAKSQPSPDALKAFKDAVDTAIADESASGRPVDDLQHIQSLITPEIDGSVLAGLLNYRRLRSAALNNLDLIVARVIESANAIKDRGRLVKSQYAWVELAANAIKTQFIAEWYKACNDIVMRVLPASTKLTKELFDAVYQEVESAANVLFQKIALDALRGSTALVRDDPEKYVFLFNQLKIEPSATNIRGMPNLATPPILVGPQSNAVDVLDNFVTALLIFFEKFNQDAMADVDSMKRAIDGTRNQADVRRKGINQLRFDLAGMLQQKIAPGEFMEKLKDKYNKFIAVLNELSADNDGRDAAAEKLGKILSPEWQENVTSGRLGVVKNTLEMNAVMDAKYEKVIDEGRVLIDQTREVIAGRVTPASEKYWKTINP